MAITRIKAETALSGTIPSTNISQSSMANVSTGTSWQAVKTTNFTAEAGKGYFVDTTSGAITVTLPSSPSAGDYVVLKDYARNWATNAVTMASAKFDGVAARTPSFSTNGQTITLVYMDSTKGWSLTNEDTTTLLGAIYISATGGTVTTSGGYKTHVFTGDGCFVVSDVGNQGSNADYLVVAGGGGGASRYYAGGGGAGGFRVSNSTCMPAPLTSPLASPTGITLTATTYPITIGAGGAAGPGSDTPGSSGSNSVFSTITSAGGGYGGTASPGNGASGGSGGGGGGNGGTGGTGNTPPVSPSQGNPGGNGNTPVQATEGGGGGGGGGASESGATSTLGQPQAGNAGVAGNGGAGSYVIAAGFGGCYGTTGPVGSTRYFSGGGGGGDNSSGGPTGVGGSGGGGRGAPSSLAGTANTGGGGGGGSHDGNPPSCGAAGGSGIVIIRYRYQ